MEISARSASVAKTTGPSIYNPLPMRRGLMTGLLFA